MKTIKRFYVGIVTGLTLLTIGMIIGVGFSFTRDIDAIRIAYNKGKRDGALELILKVLDNGEIEIANG